MGILCEACGIVHFIATLPGITLSKNIEGMYRLTCKPPCPEVKMFRKEASFRTESQRTRSEEDTQKRANMKCLKDEF